MIAARSHGAVRRRPERAELVPLTERAGLLEMLRGAFVGAAVLAAVLVPSFTASGRAALVAVSLCYLAAAALPQVLARVHAGGLVPAMGGALLLDGVYLVWLLSITGGTGSPMFALLYVHVVAVTLVASYRTGLKLAIWHSLVYLVLFQAEVSHVYTVAGGLTLLTGSAMHVVVVTRLATLWLATLVTAAFAAYAERELRTQKIDLQHLSDMVADIEGIRSQASIARSLLERMEHVFGFTRGVVLASMLDELDLQASFGETGHDSHPSSLDGVIDRAWSERQPVLARGLDAERDARLAGLLPVARNVLVIPLLASGGLRLGVLAVESSSDRVKTWVVDFVRQFASHAAMRLHNAWLHDRVQSQLEEIGLLRDEVVAQNLSLETRVAEQTQELRATVTELQDANGHRQRLLSHLVRAQEEERQRIAGDVHDDPVQRVVAVSMRLQLLRRSVTEPEVREELEQSLQSVQTCIRSMRQLLFELRPPILDERGIGAAIEEYLSGRDVAFAYRVHDSLDEQPPSEARIVLYRIAQEALANICKHAEAANVTIDVTAENDGVAIEIDDDGVGFSPETAVHHDEPGHMGLSSMRERAELAGGSCEIHSLPGDGTSVRYWIPTPKMPRPVPDRVALAG